MLLVFGMHRSGTSAMAGTLQHLGVDLGDKLQPGNEGNVRGYFEHRDIVALHERLLNSLGSHWADPFPPDLAEKSNPEVRAFREEITAVVRRDFAESRLCAFKDPRLCRLVGLWELIARDVGVELGAVIMIRSPSQVAASLAERDQFPPGKSYLLWLDYVLASEVSTRRIPRVFVEFDDLLDDWRQTAKRIAGGLELRWPVSPTRAAEEVDSFLDPCLKHHNAKVIEDPNEPVPAWVARAYELLRSGAGRDDAAFRRSLANLRRDLCEASDLFAPQVKEARADYEELFRNEAIRRQEEVADLRAHAGNLENDLAAHRHVKTLVDGELERLVAQVQEFDVDRQAQREAKSALEGEVERLGAQAQGLEADRQAHDEIKASLEGEVERLGAQVQELEADREAHTGAESALEGEVERLVAQVQELEAGRQAHREAEASLGGEVERLGAQVQELEADREVHIGAKAALEGEVERLVAQVQELEAGRQAHREAEAALEGEVVRLGTHFQQLEADGRAHVEVKAALEGEVGRLGAHIQQLEADGQAHVEAKAALKSETGQLDTLRGRLQAMEQELERGRDLGDQLRADLIASQQRVAIMEQETSEVRHESARLVHAKRAAAMRAHHLEAHLALLQDAKRDAEVLAGDVARMRGSLSWRLTRPLRGARWITVAVLRRVRRAASPRWWIQRWGSGTLKYNVEGFTVRTDSFEAPRVLHITGWCFATDDTGSVRLELRSGSEVLYSFDSSRVRPDVLRAFDEAADDSASPRCGFDEEYALGDEVVRVQLVSPAHNSVLLDRALKRAVTRAGEAVTPTAGDGVAAVSGSLPRYVLRRLRSGISWRNLRLLWNWRRLFAAVMGEYERLRLVRASRSRGVGPRRSVYGSHAANNRLARHVRSLLEDASEQLDHRPTFSVLLGVRKTDTASLSATVESVRDQVYPDWELRIADATVAEGPVREALHTYGDSDSITVIRGDFNAISDRYNEVAREAAGEFLVFLEPGHRLAPNALFEFARMLQTEASADVIYADEDKANPDGRRFGGFFKPDWSPTLLLGYDYVGKVTCIRRRLFDEIGGLRSKRGKATLYDLHLRATVATDEIYHVPKVLFHTEAPSAIDKVGRRELRRATRRVLEEHLERLGLEAEVYEAAVSDRAPFPVYQLDWPDTGPSVTIIIPTYNQHEMLKTCVESIQEETTYRDYEILVIDNGSNSEASIEYLNSLEPDGVRVVRILNDEEGFSFSRLNNEAAEICDTDYLLFLNNDTEVIEPRWLSRMMGYAQMPGVGAVGARLLYPHDAIQHAGVLLGQRNRLAPGHAFYGHRNAAPSYHYLAETTRECVAVTAACMLTKAETFRRLGGFQGDQFPVSLQDVDYGLRLRETGLRSLCVADAPLRHHESISRPREDDPIELANFKKKYRHLDDPYYNRNLSLETSFAYTADCTLDYDGYRDKPIRVTCFAHSLRLEGAPKILVELAAGLSERDDLEISVVAFKDGPLGDLLRESGIEYRIVSLPGTDNVLAGWESDEDYECSIDKVEEVIREQRPDVVVAMVVNNFFVINAAARVSVPSLWLIQESYDADVLASQMNPVMLQACEDAFSSAYRVVFGSKGTWALYERYNHENNFTYVHNAIDIATMEAQLNGLDREAARSSLGIADDDAMILTVGTICGRKDQETVVRALGTLAKNQDGFRGFLVGAREELPYLDRVRTLVDHYDLGSKVELVAETDDVARYFRAADIFAFSSLNECFPLVVLEAMAFGLPIVTTLCIGVGEQVRIGTNGLAVRFKDHRDMADKLGRLVEDDALRQAMSRNSRNMHAYSQTFDEMLGCYERLVRAAWHVR